MLTKEQEKLVARLLAPRPKPRLVTTNELSAEVMRERASRAAREAAEREQAEIQRAEQERVARLAAFEAQHWHAVEAKWHEAQARQLSETYSGFHSRKD